MVRSVERVFAFGLISDVFKPHTVASAAYVADNIRPAAWAVGLQLHDAVVEVLLLRAGFRVPPPLSVVRPACLRCIRVSSIFGGVADHLAALGPRYRVRPCKQRGRRNIGSTAADALRDQISVPALFFGTPLAGINPAAALPHLLLPQVPSASSDGSTAERRAAGTICFNHPSFVGAAFF